MKHEYLLSNTLGEKLLNPLRELAVAISPKNRIEVAQAWYVSTENEKVARILDELIDNERAWRLDLESADAVESMPAPEVRILAIPSEPADPPETVKANRRGRKPKAASTETQKTCAYCGDPIGAKKRICNKVACRKQARHEQNMRYLAKKRGEQEPAQEPVQEQPPAPFEKAMEEQPQTKPAYPTGTTWFCKTGSLAGQYLTGWELGDAVQDKKFEQGDLVVHKARGEHVATIKKDRVFFEPILSSATPAAREAI